MSRPASLYRINEVAAERLGFSRREMMNTADRRRDLSRARWVVWLLAREMTGRSYPDIGKFYRVDHTSVIHGVRRAKEIREADPDYRAAIEDVARDVSDSIPLRAGHGIASIAIALALGNAPMLVVPVAQAGFAAVIPPPPPAVLPPWLRSREPTWMDRGPPGIRYTPSTTLPVLVP